MRKNVAINVTGIHSRPGEPTEKIVTNSTGIYEYMEDGRRIIEYDEEQDPGKVASHVHNKVLIASDGKSVEIIREGDINSKLSFGEKMSYNTDYNTPYGMMQMRIVTTSFDFIHVREEDEIKVMAEYELEMEGEVLSDSMIIMEIKTAETN